MHKFRASCLGLIMTEPKSKDEVLSVGAKTYIESLAKQTVYGYDDEVSSKYLEKGLMCEDEAIELYNSVFFTSHKKNTERRTNEWITGECDIAALWKITDIKCAWSLPTFPATAAAGQDKGYEWQLRAYMWLWEVDFAEIAYCLVSTPPELIGYEREEIHIVDHITPELRITIVPYERDKSLEEKIKTKVEAANAYLEATIRKIAEEHTYES